MTIDLSFRPPCYFCTPDSEEHRVTRLQDAERRSTLAGLLDSGRHDEIAAFLANSALNAERAAL